MIIRGKHPTNPNTHTYAPRRYLSEDDAWIPLGTDEQSFERAVDAGRECLAYVLRLWSALAREVRLLRALCEHPEFEFDAPGVDSNMIREQAQGVAARLAAMTMDLEHLLDEQAESSDLANVERAKTEPGETASDG